MSTTTPKRRGSLQLINTRKVQTWGFLSVTEARMQNNFKFLPAIVTASILNPLFYLLSVGVGIGSFVNNRAGSHGIDGVKYLTFLAPALLATVAIQSALEGVTFPTLQGFKWEKLFFAMNSTPLKGRQIAFGVYFAAILQMFFAVICFYVVMGLFGANEGRHAWIAMITAAFGAASFGAFMMWLTAAIKNDDIFLTMVQRFVIMPLFLFSGTFYPLSAMPKFLQWIGWISPLWHSIELGRHFSYGHHLSGSALAAHLIFLTTLFAVGLTMAARTFEKRLAK